MAENQKLIRLDDQGGLDFGNFTLKDKTKAEDTLDGAVYKVKTFAEITKLEKNDCFVYESVPGTAVTGFTENEDGVSFTVAGDKDAEITLGLAEKTEYEIFVDGKEAGSFTTNLGGKLTVGLELEGIDRAFVKVIRK